MSHHEEGYNVIKALNAFKNCFKNDGITIDLDKFILAYRELVKFIDHLGKLFTFVAADLIDKFQNLEKCIQNDTSKNYVTVQSSVEYEKTHQIYMINHNATLSILRLIRGLDFICKFLEHLHQNQDNHKKSHELASLSYDQTLAFRHKWAVRQLVKTGFYLLPKKNDLTLIMLHGVENKTEKSITMQYYWIFWAQLKKFILPFIKSMTKMIF